MTISTPAALRATPSRGAMRVARRSRFHRILGGCKPRRRLFGLTTLRPNQ